METGLELRLSEIVGEGKNVTVSFGIENKKPLLEIVLKDARVVQIPLNKKGRMYELEANGQTLMVYPQNQMVRVVDPAGKILSQQEYSNR